MLEDIRKIVKGGKLYKYVENMVDIITTNCEECQEVEKEVRYPSVLIWVVMPQVIPISKYFYTLPNTSTMWSF
jgi:hypothetical protein